MRVVAIILLTVIAVTYATPVQAPIVVRLAHTVPSRGERVLICEATAYCYTGNRTATMTWPEAGRTVAVDPSVIPLNSRLYITCESRPEVNGTYIAEDTGGLIKGNKIDIYMRDEQQARQWGRRTVKVEVVSE